VVIIYPFRWQDGTDPSFDPDAQIDISRVLLANGEELPGGWRDIGASDLTEDDSESLMNAFSGWKGQSLWVKIFPRRTLFTSASLT
jgi:hypothetical protein